MCETHLEVFPVWFSWTSIGINANEKWWVLCVMLLDNSLGRTPPLSSVMITVATMRGIRYKDPSFPKWVLNPHQEAAWVPMHNEKVLSLQEDLFLGGSCNGLLQIAPQLNARLAVVAPWWKSQDAIFVGKAFRWARFLQSNEVEFESSKLCAKVLELTSEALCAKSQRLNVPRGNGDGKVGQFPAWSRGRSSVRNDSRWQVRRLHIETCSLKGGYSVGLAEEDPEVWDKSAPCRKMKLWSGEKKSLLPFLLRDLVADFIEWVPCVARYMIKKNTGWA